MRTVIVSALTCFLTLWAINAYHRKTYYLAQARYFFNAHFAEPPPPAPIRYAPVERHYRPFPRRPAPSQETSDDSNGY